MAEIQDHELEDASSTNKERYIQEIPPDYIFPDLQETTYRDLYIRAYKEVMEVAMDKCSWLRDLPELDSVRDGLMHLPELVPMSASNIISMMMDVRQWKRSFVHIIYSCGEFNTGNALQFLQNEDAAIKNVIGVRTKFQLPTAFAPMLNFSFLRYLKEIRQGIYAIIDVSDNYFDYYVDTNQKLSGVIIKEKGQESEIIWLETVIVPGGQGINSAAATVPRVSGGKRWISALKWYLKRKKSSFLEHKINVHEKAGPNLLKIASSMKIFYKECVAENPDIEMFEVYTSRDELRIMGIKSRIAEDVLDLKACICVTSLRFKDKTPLSVFEFLVQKNLQLSFASLPSSDQEPEQLLTFATDDYSNSITLHRKKIGQETKFFLQEASRDDYCGFVISRPMREDEVNKAVSGLTLSKEELLNNAVSGFAVMPYGVGHFNSNDAYVTWVMQLNRNPELHFVEATTEVFKEISNRIE